MTKKEIKENLEKLDYILLLDYHDFLSYYNKEIYLTKCIDTDFYSVFEIQRNLCHAIIKQIVTGVGGGATTNKRH